jgi:hypothetical protein
MGGAVPQVAHMNFGNRFVTFLLALAQSTDFPAIFHVRDVTLWALRSHYFMTTGRVKRLHRGSEKGPMRMNVVGAWGHGPDSSWTVKGFGRVFCPPVSR